VCCLPHGIRQCGVDKLAQCRLDICLREINTKANSRRLGEQRLDDRQDRQLSTTALRDHCCP
jgi:hypothetical protein